MSQIVSASIDLNKIDKTRIKAGQKGEKFYNISILLNDEVNAYGQDVGITEGQTKEERTAKTKAKFIGNGKTVWRSAPAQNNKSQNIESTSQKDDLPF